MREFYKGDKCHCVQLAVVNLHLVVLCICKVSEFLGQLCIKDLKQWNYL